MKILFFTPHVAIWGHTVPEAYLARALSDLGHDVQYMTCARAQTYCAPMSAHGYSPTRTPEQAERVCRICEGGAAALQKAYGFETFSLAQYLRPEDREACDALARRALDQKSLDTRSHGVDVGRLALYEFTLAHKKMSTVLSAEQWQDYRIYLFNALITLHAFARFMDETVPDAIATFSPQYSNINSCMQYALNRGVRVLFMESGTNISHRLGTMRVWDWGVHKLVNPALRYWQSSDLNPVSEEAARAVSRHFGQLLSGQHFAVFSSPYAGKAGIRDQWSIRPEQRLLLMTLSSYDEAYAALLIDAFPEEKVFSDVYRTQAEWVKATIEWVRDRPDLFLVIRVHPRDFPNKREQVRSEQSLMLEGLLQGVPANVHVNWPAEGISLYQLLEDTDVILTGWSVTAMEGLILGIPVVTYDERLPSYPRDIMRTGRSAEAYFENIDAALEEGWSIRNVVNGFRWLAYNFVTATVTASRRFGNYELANRTYFDRAIRRVAGKFPRLTKLLELSRWRGAKAGAKVLDAMLTQGYDAVVAVRAQSRKTEHTRDDRHIIHRELRHLHDILYSKSLQPADKPGLSRNIRNYLKMETSE